VNAPAPQRETDREQPLIEHLAELRTRLMRAITCVFAIFVVLSFFANRIYATVATPLLAKLPSGAAMIATEVASPFLVPFKLAAFASLFLAMPYLLYQVWAFVAPGLYLRERRFVLPLLVSSSVLFYAGMAFAFFVVFPLLFGFFTAIAPPGVTVMTDIGHYLDFILKMFFAFGLAFEIPIATILLVRAGILSAEDMARKRPYVIVAAFTIGMLLTPPDVLSQVLLAVPIWFLFEAGLLASRYIAPAGEEGDTATDGDGGA
jgi:sec-independent protein translocase protein TatC